MVKIETCIILLSHGKWANYLVEDVKKNFGLSHKAEVFSLFPEMSIEDYTKKVSKFVETINKDSLIIADLFGSSTANVATLMTMKFGLNAITGLSVQTLLIADEELTKESQISIADRVVGRNKNLCSNLCNYVEKIKEG